MTRASATRPQVVAVDDDEQLRRLLEQSLAREGFDVTTVSNAESALAVVATASPDLLIVDLYLPGMSGLDLLQELRAHDVAIPTILLTGEQSEGTRVMGLDLGADDYVVKPFSARELAARVRAILRRTSLDEDTDAISHGDLIIDPMSHSVELAGQAIDLTRKEFELLSLLASSPGRAFTYDEMLDAVWGSRREWQDPATVTEHVRRIRKKLGESAKGSRITTLQGVGYRFDG